jgi:hypothetical protein
MVRQARSHRGGAWLPFAILVALTQSSHRPAKVVAEQTEVAHGFMDFPVFGKTIGLSHFAAVAMSIRSVLTLNEDRVHVVADRGEGQGRHDRSHGPVDHALIDLHDPILFARLVHGRIVQAFGSLFRRRRLPTAGAFALWLNGFPVGLQDGFGVGRILVAGHQVHLPTFRPLMKILDQPVRLFFGPSAHHDAHDQAMFGVKSHVIPAVAAQVVVGIISIAVLFLFLHERPLFVELDFLGVGGKKPRVHRGVLWPGRPPVRRNGPPYSCSRR